MKDIRLVCFGCLEKTQDYNEAVLCNVDYNIPSQTYTFQCSICGFEKSFQAGIFSKKLTGKKLKLYIEKRSIEEELEVKQLKN